MALNHTVSISGNTGIGGNVFKKSTAYTIPISGNQVLPAGTYLVLVDANGKIQFNTTGSTWVDIEPVANGGLMVSDGAAVRVLNTSASVTSALTIISVQ